MHAYVDQQFRIVSVPLVICQAGELILIENL
jgi:hypothetical protein